MFLLNEKAKLNLIFNSKLKKKNVKVLSELVHKPKILARSNLHK
jgi:hypothetical protein